MRLRLADPLVGLSSVADLGFGLPPGEALRCCALATALARRLDLPGEERILTGSATLTQAAAWAGRHHERLDGSGYHRGCGARELPMPVRVLAAADALQAMTQSRPHRAALPVDEAAARLRADRGHDPDAVAAVVAAAGQGTARRRRTRPAGLSEREIEVLALVARGCTNKEIARRLVISRRTAEHHVAHIYDKIGVASRAAAALFAMQHDLLENG